MFKPLLRVNPSLSGNVKLALLLTDYESYSDDDFNGYVRDARLFPLSHNIMQSNIKVNMLGSSYERDLYRYFKKYSDIFYTNQNDYSQTELKQINKASDNPVRNTDFEMGCKRISYIKNNNTFAFFAPIYIDNIKDLPAYFKINIEFTNKIYTVKKTLRIRFDITNTSKDYLNRYFTTYVSKIDNKVITVDPDSIFAYYHGIDCQQGGFVNSKDVVIGELLSKHNSINNFDSIVCGGFQRRKVAMKQIIPVSFYFDPEELLNEREKNLFKYAQIKFSGNYYNTDNQVVNWYDINMDYDNYTDKVLSYNESAGALQYKDGINVMDQQYPSMYESTYTGYIYSNKIAPLYNRWKLLQSSDEHPYIINNSYGYSLGYSGSAVYGQYPGQYQSPYALVDLSQGYTNLILPNNNKLYTDNFKYYKLLYNNAINKYAFNWFQLYSSEADFEKLKCVKWNDVERNRTYYNGVLYDFNNIYDSNDKAVEFDKFAIVLNPNLIDNSQLKTAKYVFSKNNITSKDAYISPNFIENYLSESTVSMYRNGDDAVPVQYDYNKRYIQDPNGRYTVLYKDIDIQNRYYNVNDVSIKLNDIIEYLNDKNDSDDFSDKTIRMYDNNISSNFITVDGTTIYDLYDISGNKIDNISVRPSKIIDSDTLQTYAGSLYTSDSIIVWDGSAYSDIVTIKKFNNNHVLVNNIISVLRQLINDINDTVKVYSWYMLDVPKFALYNENSDTNVFDNIINNNISEVYSGDSTIKKLYTQLTQEIYTADVTDCIVKGIEDNYLLYNGNRFLCKDKQNITQNYISENTLVHKSKFIYKGTFDILFKNSRVQISEYLNQLRINYDNIDFGNLHNFQVLLNNVIMYISNTLSTLTTSLLMFNYNPIYYYANNKVAHNVYTQEQHNKNDDYIYVDPFNIYYMLFGSNNDELLRDYNRETSAIDHTSLLDIYITDINRPSENTKYISSTVNTGTLLKYKNKYYITNKKTDIALSIDILESKKFITEQFITDFSAADTIGIQEYFIKDGEIYISLKGFYTANVTNISTVAEKVTVLDIAGYSGILKVGKKYYIANNIDITKYKDNTLPEFIRTDFDKKGERFIYNGNIYEIINDLPSLITNENTQQTIDEYISKFYIKLIDYSASLRSRITAYNQILNKDHLILYYNLLSGNHSIDNIYARYKTVNVNYNYDLTSMSLNDKFVPINDLFNGITAKNDLDKLEQIQYNKSTKQFYIEEAYEFDIVYKSDLFRIDSYLLQKMIDEKPKVYTVNGKHLSVRNTDLYLYVREEPEDYNGRICLDINKEADMSNIGSCFKPLFTSPRYQQFKDTVTYDELISNNIIYVNKELGSANVKVNTNNIQYLYECSDEELKLIDPIYRFSIINYPQADYIRVEGADDYVYKNYNINYIKTSEGNYGLYYINMFIDNTDQCLNLLTKSNIIPKYISKVNNDSLFIKVSEDYALLLNDYSAIQASRKDYHTVLGASENISYNNYTFNSFVEKLLPFVKINFYSLFNKIKYRVIPKRYKITAKNVSHKINDGESVIVYNKNSSDIIINHRYITELTPLIQETSIINNLYNFKYKSIEAPVISSGKSRYTGDYTLYKLNQNINMFDGIKIYDKDNKHKETYYPLEYKSFNCSKAINLPKQITYEYTYNMTYSQMIRNESSEVVFDVFKQLIGKYLPAEINKEKVTDLELKYLFLKYDIEYDSEFTAVDSASKTKLFKLKYNFKLL